MIRLGEDDESADIQKRHHHGSQPMATRPKKPLISRVKSRVRQSELYFLLGNIGVGLVNRVREVNNPKRRMVSLKPQKAPRGNVLLSMFIEPFLMRPEEVDRHFHVMYWKCLEMARTFLDLGYCVDAIDTFNYWFIPEKKYAVLIDERFNLERLAKLLNRDCVRIMYIDIGNTLFNSAAELNRLVAVQQRKKVTLRPRRFEWPNLAIEHADCAFGAVNEFSINTFRYANKPIYRLPNPTPVLCPWQEAKDFEACRHRFLWLGPRGLVHKGLDLVLEAFAEMPEYHLTVCAGPIEQEKDFERAYYKELYQTPNIRFVGFVDVQGPEFIEITRNCLGFVYASCSEAQSGSVVACLHAGLIPIIGYECDIDVGDFGRMLNDCSVGEIKNAVRTVSSLPVHELERMARSAWGYARANHTRERFTEEFRNFIVKILTHHGHL
jgi:glycosyltransferase involved in cell wall biosynthesis